jgi:hypothetical protein
MIPGKDNGPCISLFKHLALCQGKIPLDKVLSKCTKSPLPMLYDKLIEEAHVNITI